MSYSAFGKVKTIVLPINGNEDLSYEQYKEKYGIDLKDVIYLQGTSIRIREGALVLVQAKPSSEMGYDYFPSLFAPNYYQQEDWKEGNAQGILSLGLVDTGSAAHGIRFYVESDDEFKIENVNVMFFEM